MSINSIASRKVFIHAGVLLSFGLICTVSAADVPNACPSANAWVAQQKQEGDRTTKKNPSASDRKLHAEIMAMAKVDEDERQKLIDAQGADQSLIKRMESSDADHLRALRRIAPKGVLPDVGTVGVDGMNALLILVQHANGDQEFQREVLRNLDGRVKSGEVSGEAYALLTDRVLMQENRPQVFGTQMSVVNNTVQLYKVDTPLGLEQRRKAVGLMPMKDYECVISMAYKMPFARPERIGAQ
jgi:hypothetical protein